MGQLAVLNVNYLIKSLTTIAVMRVGYKFMVPEIGSTPRGY